jgi:hypothetical protein
MDNMINTELTVRSESLQSLYSKYRADRFSVNRRYQRKLVWSVLEKQRLVDSILKNLPIPLFLVAETGIGADASYEVIDGMQRLNAIFSFLENEFPVNGQYFDLDALADTKSLKDLGRLAQKESVLTRQHAVSFSNYSVALSVFRATDSASVDEVFRRINSGGRQLSRQELRQAGTVSTLAELVRVISSKIRGDTSPGDVVPLKSMPQLSITSRELNYGVDVDQIFWVRHGILRREDVRTSLDEQLVLDIVIDMLVDPIPTISKDVRDAYYDFSEEVSADAHAEIETAISVYGRDDLQRDFLNTYSVLRSLLEEQDEGPSRFASLIGVPSGGRSPRYYHGLFIAVYELMFRDRLRVRDSSAVASRLDGMAKHALNIPSGSGIWTGESKRHVIDAVKGVLRSAFERVSDGSHDFSRFSWSSEFETLLGNALVEQQLFECKQGLHRLAEPREIDASMLRKIGRTATAMANAGPNHVGHVVLGVADSRVDAARVEQLDGVTGREYRGFHVVGLGREARLRSQELGDYWKWILQQLRDDESLDPRVRANIARDARIVSYLGQAVGLLRIENVGEPVFYGGKLYERVGSETREVETTEFGRLFTRFRSSRAVG